MSEEAERVRIGPEEEPGVQEPKKRPAFPIRVDWNDGNGAFFCALVHDRNNHPSAVSIETPKRFKGAFALEAGADVVEVQQAMVDWNEGSGPHAARLVVAPGDKLGALTEDGPNAEIYVVDSECKVVVLKGVRKPTLVAPPLPELDAEQSHKTLKRPKDPTAPIGPRTAFILWSQTMRAAVKKRHPSFSRTELMTELGNMWQKLGEPFPFLGMLCLGDHVALALAGSALPPAPHLPGPSVPSLL